MYNKTRNTGEKPRENTRKTGKMKNLKIINFTVISEELTGNKDAIRSNRIPRKYKESFEDLNELLEAWLKCTKRRTDNQQKK